MRLILSLIVALAFAGSAFAQAKKPPLRTGALVARPDEATEQRIGQPLGG